MQWKLSQHTLLDIKSTFNSSARDLVWRNEDGGPQAKDDIDPVTNDYVNRESQHEGFKSNTTELRTLTNYTLGKMSNTLSAGLRFYGGKMKRQGGGEGTTGSDFDFTLVNPGYKYDLNFTTINLAAYVENTFRLNDKLSVTPGLRYEHINSSVKGFNPSKTDGTIVYSDQSKKRNILLAGISLQYNTSSSTNIYANWSQAYRPLDYSSLTPFGTISTVDPDLKDSKGTNTDVGFRGSVKNFLNFDVGGFYLQYDDRVGIVEKTDALGNQFPFRTNVANSVHKGFESYVEFNPVKAFTGWQKWSLSFFNSLGLINAQYVSGEFKGNFVEYAPCYINRFGTNVVIGKFSTTFLLSSTGKSYADAGNSVIPSNDAVAGAIPAYDVMDWSSTWKIKNYTLRFGLNNLGDKRYFTKRTDEYPGPGIIPSTGRSFYFGFGAKF
jgi:Fe(3+) dicitrate transport protein